MLDTLLALVMAALSFCVLIVAATESHPSGAAVGCATVVTIYGDGFDGATELGVPVSCHWPEVGFRGLTVAATIVPIRIFRFSVDSKPENLIQLMGGCLPRRPPRGNHIQQPGPRLNMGGVTQRIRARISNGRRANAAYA